MVLAEGPEEDPVPTCPECNAHYTPSGGGHCRDGCHRTFTSDSAASAHRTGPYEPRSARRCLTDEELAGMTRKDGSLVWTLTPRGWSNSPVMTEEERARAKARRKA
jgi:hypothetical protein